jgi:hypothetical protein
MAQQRKIPGNLQVGNPTGGNTGDGTINAQGYFIDGEELKLSDPLGTFINVANSNLVKTRLTNTSLNTIYTYTGTQRAIVSSVVASNINGFGGNESQITMVLRDHSVSTDFFITANIPVPAGTSVELLRKPKVLEPSDALKFQALTANAFELTITIAEFEDDASLFNASFATNTASVTNPVAVYTESNSSGSVIDSILLSTVENGQNGTLTNVSIWDGTTDRYIVFELNVPEKTTIELVENVLHLPNNHSIRVKVSEEDKVIVNVSGRKIL